MNQHTNSLNPARQPGESFEDYKERRRQLQTVADKAGRRGRLLYNSETATRRGVRVPLKKEKESA